MAKDEQDPAAVEAGGGSKKKLIIIGAGVAVAIILGAVVFMMMGKGDKKEAGKEGADTKTEAKAEGGGHGGAAAPKEGGGKEGAAAAGANIFPLEPFIVNIYDGQELRYLKVKVEMEMAGPGVKAVLDGRLAPIRDAILVLLSSKTMQDIQDIQGKNQLKEEILAAVNKHIPPGQISKIYFTDFVVQ
ncbi:MAG: flagellar basal body protein FliL [Desulfuromonadaceae bacterium GWB2_53_15]|nr:MAG: flagellar basal body protein FliL [Desulfuromonadales bacterium GWD2_54_10]OHB25270.1 MAG: flagellar basal body protein FliL [Desulfuromonadaceae bacterium GWB2_53_15]